MSNEIEGSSGPATETPPLPPAASKFGCSAILGIVLILFLFAVAGSAFVIDIPQVGAGALALGAAWCVVYFYIRKRGRPEFFASPWRTIIFILMSLVTGAVVVGLAILGIILIASSSSVSYH